MVVTMKQLLEAGVSLWTSDQTLESQMKPYIFTERNNIYIIDLKNRRISRRGLQFCSRSAQQRRNISLCRYQKTGSGSHRAGGSAVRDVYVNQRWLGGMITNFLPSARASSD